MGKCHCRTRYIMILINDFPFQIRDKMYRIYNYPSPILFHLWPVSVPVSPRCFILIDIVSSDTLKNIIDMNNRELLCNLGQY